MTPLMVSWEDRSRGIVGRLKAGKAPDKIIFPKRGREAACCLKPGHSQECRIVRDTKADDPRSGALIVEVIRECQDCIREQSFLTPELIAEGWKFNTQGRVIAPDGKGGGVNPTCSYPQEKLETERKLFLARQRAAAIAATLTDEFFALAACLPYPEGEPAIPALPVQPVDREWVEINHWDRAFDVMPDGTRHRNDYGELAQGATWAINREGELGTIRVSPKFEYLSDDERGMRNGGGVPCFYAPNNRELNDPKFRASFDAIKSHPLTAVLAAEVKAQHDSFPARMALYEAEKEARIDAHRVWWRWWMSLSDAQKARRAMQSTEEGRLAAVRTTKNGEKIFFPPDNGRDGRKYRSYDLTFPFRPVFDCSICGRYEVYRLECRSGSWREISVLSMLAATEVVVDYNHIKE